MVLRIALTVVAATLLALSYLQIIGGLLLLWVSALVTMYTGYDYFRAGIHHLIEEDQA